MLDTAVADHRRWSHGQVGSPRPNGVTPPAAAPLRGGGRRPGARGGRPIRHRDRSAGGRLHALDRGRPRPRRRRPAGLDRARARAGARRAGHGRRGGRARGGAGGPDGGGGGGGGGGGAVPHHPPGGRSRNDQVALDLRLWLRRTLGGVDAALVELERALVGRAERDGEAVMPGMTHIQPAQPVLLAHHLLAYVEMLERDRGRVRDAWARADRSPLGAGALAGAGFGLDREATAAELGFAGVTANSLDAVSDRGFVVESLAAAALCMVHLSRLAEELVWGGGPALRWVAPPRARGPR